MQRLGDLFSIILNVVFVFATVSYIASSMGEGLSGILRWRARFLLNSIEALLDDLDFKGPARDLYNNLLFNPLGDGHLRSKADVSDYSMLPTSVDPLVFGQAMLEILGFDEVARNELAKSSTLDRAAAAAAADADAAAARAGVPAPVPPGGPSLASFVAGAKAALNNKRDNAGLSERLRGLALNMLERNANKVKNTPQTQQPALSGDALEAKLITDLLIAMLMEMGNWFSFSQVLASAKYMSRMRMANFAVGFVLAAVLDLQPIPTGGSSLAGKLPYGVAAFQWLIVGASTLLGSSFWFEILKKIAPAIVGAQSKGNEPTAGLSGQARMQERTAEAQVQVQAAAAAANARAQGANATSA
jgi:hypothetical protein